MEHPRSTLTMRTSVEVNEEDSSLVVHSPHSSDDWRASSFWRLMPKGEWAHNYPCGSVYLRSLARSFIYLS
jgi:hypothetical protein